MAKLMEFPTADGSVLVEIADEPGGLVTRGMSGTRVIERAQQTFEDAIARVQPAMDGMINQFRSLAERPDEVRVEFGLDLHAEVGAFVAAGSTSANFKVALTWRNDSSKE